MCRWFLVGVLNLLVRGALCRRPGAVEVVLAGATL